MAIDSIPPNNFTLLQLSIPTLENALRVQPQRCFAPIARRLEAYWLEYCEDEIRGVLTTDAGKCHDDHPLADVHGNYTGAWLQASPT